MKNCKHTEECLIAFDGKSTIDKETIAHIQQCESCNTLYANTLSFHEAIHNEKKTQSPPFLATRVMAALEKVEKQGIIQFNLRRELQLVFVGIALILGIFSSVFFNKGHEPAENTPVLTDYFFTENTGIEQQWLNFDNYENEQ